MDLCLASIDKLSCLSGVCYGPADNDDDQYNSGVWIAASFSWQLTLAYPHSMVCIVCSAYYQASQDHRQHQHRHHITILSQSSLLYNITASPANKLPDETQNFWDGWTFAASTLFQEVELNLCCFDWQFCFGVSSSSVASKGSWVWCLRSNHSR